MTAKEMVKANINGKIVIDIKDNGKIMLNMEKALFTIQMEKYILANGIYNNKGLIIKKMEKEDIFI
jgi:hypothetical protein